MNRRTFVFSVPAALAGGAGFGAESPATPLAAKIDQAAQASLVGKRAFWGAHAINLTTGQPVYAHQEGRFFVPASNAKLFSTALALTRLGPEHRFSTSLGADGPIDAEGVLSGNLRLIGGGDPTLSGRPFPYSKNGKAADPMGPLEALAEEAVKAGLRQVTGDIVGDDSAYVWEPYPPGWSLEDTLYHDNTVRIDVRGGDNSGDRALADLRPAGAYFFVESHVSTGPEQRVQADRGAGHRLLTVWGSLRPGAAVTLAVPVPDPAHYAAHCLREALERRGVRVLGGVKARHRYFWHQNEPQDPPEPTRVLATRQSPPLIELLKVVNKVSQNLHAELALREVARAKAAHGSRRAALAEMAVFLRRAGISAGDVNLIDASGLSRQTLVTPAALTALLKYMYASPNRRIWLETLPIGGEDGTLSTRFRGLDAGRVLAKTGSLAHVNALSGYLENARGETLAFSVIVNNAYLPAGAARTFIDNLVGLLAE
jgi:D-alanyl-D-alanine carboxypeptidase/D-alanyl-D-alanine-endopeptidase (penicillin-binding protein 4)